MQFKLYNRIVSLSTLIDSECKCEANLRKFITAKMIFIMHAPFLLWQLQLVGHGWHALAWTRKGEHLQWYQWVEWVSVKEGRVDHQLEELLRCVKKIDSGLSEPGHERFSECQSRSESGVPGHDSDAVPHLLAVPSPSPGFVKK